MVFRKMSVVWDHFTDVGSAFATCNICKVKLSFKTTVSNLKKHLERKHPTVQIVARTSTQPQHTDENTHPLAVKQDEDSSSNFDSKKCDSEAWAQFEVEGSTVHCAICDKTLGDRVEDMEKHLEEHHHPVSKKKQLKMNTKPDSSDSENEKNQESDSAETVTEIVYLADKKSMNNLKRKNSSFHRTEKKRERLSSGTRKEISSFVDYISVLLEKVHSDSLSDLQVDIINMILKRRKRDQYV